MISQKISRGFTLIELMIVIAIIGILASLALPAYQNYVGRTQATEALVVTSGLRNDIGVYFWANRTWPTASDTIIATANSLDGKYFDSPSGVTLTPNTGVITVNFSKGVNANKHVTLTPRANAGNGQVITWTCSGDVGPDRLPKTCQ